MSNVKVRETCSKMEHRPFSTHHVQLLITVNVQFPPFRLLSAAYATIYA
jgi:hypothetical protein